MSNIVLSGKSPVGVHVIINLYDINDSELLNFRWAGRDVLNEAILHLNLNVVNEAGHQFQPFGYTYAYVLSESHLTIHTYPEYKSCYIDIFCCNPSFNPNRAVAILKHLFNTDTATYNIFHR
jgi:S-adenosylmethionine decarboxylase proenzyme